MAVSQLTETALGTSLFQDTQNQSTAVAIKASSAIVYTFDIDNTANAAASYVKFYNVAQGSVTVGTTAPDFIVLAPASTRVSPVFTAGLTFGTALTVATVTAGGTAGTSNPSSAVIVRCLYT